MATRINTKFVIILASVLVVLTAGIVYAVLQFNRGPADYVRMGDQHMEQAQAALEEGEIEDANALFKKAASRYGDARDKDPQGTSYIYKWIEAQNSIICQESGAAYTQMEEEIKGASTIHNTVGASDEDRAYLYELVHKRMRINLSARQHPLVMLRNFATKRLAQYPKDTVALKYAVIADSEFPHPDDAQRKPVIERLDRALEAHPKDPWVRTAAARFYLIESYRLYQASGKNRTEAVITARKKALGYVTEAIELAKDNPGAMIVATELLRRMPSDDPEAAPALIAQKIEAIAGLNKQLSDKAMRDKLEVEEIAKAIELIAALNKTGEEDAFDGVAEAHKLAKAVVKERPDQPLAHGILAESELKQKNHKAAADASEKGLSIDKLTNGPQYVRQQAAKMEILSTLAQAKIGQAFEKGIDRDKRITLLDESGKRIEQIATLSISPIRTNDRETEVEYLRGRLEFARGQRDEAITHFTNVVQKNEARGRNDQRPLQYLANCYLSVNQPGKAAEQYEKILKINQASPLRLQLINTYLASPDDPQNLARAEQHIEVYEQIAKGDVRSVVLRARLLDLRKQTTEAIELLKKQDLEKNPFIKSLIAGYQAKLGDSTNAIAMLRAKIAERKEATPISLADVERLLNFLKTKKEKLAELDKLQADGLPKKIADLYRGYVETGNRTLEGELAKLEYNALEPGKAAFAKFRLYRGFNKFELAEEQLKKADRLDPGNPEVVGWKYKLAVADERWDDAQAAMDEMLAITDKPLPEMAVADGAFMRAQLKAVKAAKMPPGPERTEALRDARKDYEEAIKQYRDYMDGWVQLARIQFVFKDYIEAEQSLLQVLAQQSRNTDALSLMARLAIVKDDLPQALRRFEQLLRISPGDTRALAQYTLVARQLGQPELATQMRETVRDLARGDIQNRRVLVVLYLESKEYEKALKEVSEIIALDGKSVANLSLLSKALVDSGQNDKAIEVIKKYLEEKGDDADWRDLALMALTYNLAGDTGRADIMFQQAIKKEGDETIGAAGQWAQALLQRKEPAKAAELMEGLIKQRPKNQLLREQTARLYLQAKDLDKAKAIAEAMDKSETRALLLIGIAVSKEGGQAKAMRLAKQAYADYPDSEALGLQLGRLMLREQSLRKPDEQSFGELNKLTDKLVNDQPNSALLRLLKADVLLAQNKTEQADVMLDAVLELDSDNIKANQNKYSIAIRDARTNPAERESKATEALVIAKRLIRLEPENGLYHSGAGDAAQLLGRAEEAGNHYAKALEFEKRPSDLSKLVQILLSMNRGAQAKAALDRPEFASIVSNDLGLRALRGRAFAASGDAAQAVTVFRSVLRSTKNLDEQMLVTQQILASFPGDSSLPMQVVDGALGQGVPPMLDNLLGRWLIDNQRNAEAARRLAKYQASAPNSPQVQYQVQMTLALALQQSDQFKESKSVYDSVHELVKKNDKAFSAINKLQLLNNLAYLLSDKMPGQEKQAVAYAEQAVGLLPKNSNGGLRALIEDTLGWAYFKAGQAEKARQTLEASVGRAKLAANQYHLGRVHLAAGDKAKASELMSAALKSTSEKDTDLRKEIRAWLAKAN